MSRGKRSRRPVFASLLWWLGYASLFVLSFGLAQSLLEAPATEGTHRPPRSGSGIPARVALLHLGRQSRPLTHVRAVRPGLLVADIAILAADRNLRLCLHPDRRPFPFLSAYRSAETEYERPAAYSVFVFYYPPYGGGHDLGHGQPRYPNDGLSERGRLPPLGNARFASMSSPAQCWQPFAHAAKESRAHQCVDFGKSGRNSQPRTRRLTRLIRPRCWRPSSGCAR